MVSNSGLRVFWGLQHRSNVRVQGLGSRVQGLTGKSAIDAAAHGFATQAVKLARHNPASSESACVAVDGLELDDPLHVEELVKGRGRRGEDGEVRN